jgi:hypothetical protein
LNNKIKYKNTKITRVGTVPNSNRKIVERDKIDARYMIAEFPGLVQVLP